MSPFISHSCHRFSCKMAVHQPQVLVFYSSVLFLTAILTLSALIADYLQTLAFLLLSLSSTWPVLKWRWSQPLFLSSLACSVICQSTHSSYASWHISSIKHCRKDDYFASLHYTCLAVKSRTQTTFQSSCSKRDSNTLHT